MVISKQAVIPTDNPTILIVANALLLKANRMDLNKLFINFLNILIRILELLRGFG